MSFPDPSAPAALPAVKEKKRRHRQLSLQSKLQILADVDNSIGSKKDIAAKYNIPSNTLSTIIKKRDKVETAAKILFFEPGRKRMRESNYSEIDRQLFAWVRQAQYNNEPVNGITLAERADYLAEKLGFDSFKVTHGWVDRFKKRHGIRCTKRKHMPSENIVVSGNHQTSGANDIPFDFDSSPGPSNVKLEDSLSSAFNGNGEAVLLEETTSQDDLELVIASIFKPKVINKQAAQDWSKADLPYVLDEFQPADIFCADETELYFRCVPDKLQSMTKGKGAKDKVTVLCGVNMTGIEKLPLLIIGKLPITSSSNIKNLPLEYVVEKTTAMTQSIFESWLDQVEEKFQDDGRKIALVLSSSAAHSCVLVTRFKAIKIVFLPLDTPTLLQPCSQGIIHSFKTHYRTRVVQKYLLHARNEINRGNYNCANCFSLSITNALYYMRSAWDQVEKDTIVSSFRHAGFHVKQKYPVIEEDSHSHLNHLLNRLSHLVPIETTSSTFVDIDEELEQAHQIQRNSKDAEKDQNSTQESLQAPVSTAEATKAIELLKRYVGERDVDSNVFQAICSIEACVEKLALSEVVDIKQEIPDEMEVEIGDANNKSS